MQFQQKSVKTFCENQLAVGNLWERLLHTWLIVNYALQILAGVKHVLNVYTRMQPLPSAPGSWLASTWQHTRAGNHCRQGGQKDQGVWPGCFNMRSQEEELGEEMKDRGQGWVWETGGTEWPQHHVLLKGRNGQNGVRWGEGWAVGLEAHLSSGKGVGDRTQGKLFVLSLVLNFGI